MADSELTLEVESGQLDSLASNVGDGVRIGEKEPFSRYEFDLFRDALANVNHTLRFQLSLNVPLLAACITVLNLVPPQTHEQLLNELDRYVFIPVIVSMVLSYMGLERHRAHPQAGRIKLDLDLLYNLVRYKYKMVHRAQVFQTTALVLFILFVLLEYK